MIVQKCTLGHEEIEFYSPSCPLCREKRRSAALEKTVEEDARIGREIIEKVKRLDMVLLRREVNF